MILARYAAKCDIPALIGLCEKIWSESKDYQFYAKDYEYIYKSLSNMFDNPNVYIGIAYDYDIDAGKDTKYIGFMIGMSGSAWFSPTKEATELVLFVQKEYRGTRAAMKLVKDFERFAKDAQCARIVAGTSLKINDTVVKKFYKGLGYTVDGDTFTKVLNV